MLKDRTCIHCKKTFEKIDGRIFSNHVKWCIENKNSPKNNNVKCDKCGEVCNSLSIHSHKCKEIKKCLLCNNDFKVNGNEHIFCSHSCFAKYNNKKRIENGFTQKGYKFSLEERKCEICSNIFITPKNVGNRKCDICRGIKKIGKKRYILLPAKCEICGKDMLYRKGQKIKKTCSTECYCKLLSQKSKSNLNCGGETNYRRYRYQDILMDSTWEVKAAELMDSLSIKWERSKKLCLWWYDENNDKRRYHPDFYLPDYDVYIDTKNKYLLKQDEYKIKKVLENNKVTLKVGLLEDIETYIKSLIIKSIG